MTQNNGSLPEHKNPNQDRRSTAPYNFIPLPEKVISAVDRVEDLPDHDRYDPSRKSGFFEVELETVTPVYIRGPLTVEEFAEQDAGSEKPSFRDKIKNKPEFFHGGDKTKPIIPGSSLRGMLRNLLEIASYSKMQWALDRQLIYRAVGDMSAVGGYYREQMLGPNKAKKPNELHFDYPSRNVKAGYLVKSNNSDSGWAIQPALEFCGESFVHVEYDAAQKINIGQGGQIFHSNVFVQPVKRETTKRSGRLLKLDLAVTTEISKDEKHGLARACLVESGHMGSKFPKPGDHPKHMHCAVYDKDQNAKPIEIKRELWNIYKEDRDLTRGLPTRKLKEANDPLFYLLGDDGMLVFFGPTMMFRLPYKDSPKDLIPEALRQEASIDYAEALFGYVRGSGNHKKQGDKGQAYAGRVFVTDASLQSDQETIFENTIVPKILATPKPTSFQHYLTQFKPDSKKELNHYDSPKVTIRGHKLYWHRGKVTGKEIEDENVKDNSTQNTQIKPIKPGVCFKFRVYFENLDERELGALCWVLHPLGVYSKKYYHKLGMGKPLGMGAIKLSAVLHRVNRRDRYTKLFCDGNWDTGVAAEPSKLADRATLEQLVSPFEEHVRGELNCAENHLSGLERIKMLLAMLEWREDRDDIDSKTEYVQDLKKFRERKVLPDPLCVAESFGAKPQQADSPKTPSNPSSVGSGRISIGELIKIGNGGVKKPSAVAKREEIVTLTSNPKGGKAKVKTSAGMTECIGIPGIPVKTKGEKIPAEVSISNSKAVSAKYKKALQGE